MTEVTADARQQVKAAAARQAVFDNNLAAGSGIIAVLVPVPAAKVAFGVGSGLFWLLANYRQSVANDPARDDFGDVWESSASFDDSLLPESEPEATLTRFAAYSLLAADADYALYISLERYDGALAAGDLDAAERQAQAVQFNANASAIQQDTLASLASEVNEIANQQLADSGRTWDTVSLEDAQALYSQICGSDISDLTSSEAVSGAAAIVSDAAGDLLVAPTTDLVHPILGVDSLPPQPDVLIGQDYLDSAAQYSAALRSITS